MIHFAFCFSLIPIFLLPSSADLFTFTPLSLLLWSSFPTFVHLFILPCPVSFILFLSLFYTYFSITSPVFLLSSSSAQALCLSDEPRAVKEYRYPEKLPGELYDADTQCKWQFGEKAKLCTLDFKKVK